MDDTNFLTVLNVLI